MEEGRRRTENVGNRTTEGGKRRKEKEENANETEKEKRMESEATKRRSSGGSVRTVLLHRQSLVSKAEIEPSVCPFSPLLFTARSPSCLALLFIS